MNVSKRNLIGMGLTTVAAIAGLTLWLVPSEPTVGSTSAHHSRPTPDEHMPASPVSSTAAMQQSDPNQQAASEHGAFRKGDTYESLVARLQGKMDSNPNARALLAEASALCENLDGSMASPKKPDGSTQEYRAWRHHFCGHARDHDAARFRTTLDTLGEAKQLVDENGGLIQGKTQQAIAIVLKSTSYADIQAAGDYLMYMPDAQWDLGKAEVTGTPMAGKLKELQRTAIESVACIYSGACDEGGLKTMQICAMKRLCAPGVTLYEVWENTYSPKEMATIYNIQRALLKQREMDRS